MGGGRVCVWLHSGSCLTTADDDLASEVRHQGSDTGGACGMCVGGKKRALTIGEENV